ncbi:MAG: TM2 domain-containing protein [Bacteroidales bacterium]|nr:TM2 domain-containing protein [Bacteroidales bacterium]
MKKTLFILVAMFGFCSLSFADKYSLDNDVINNAFASATEVSLDNLNLGDLNLTGMDMNLANSLSMASRGSDKHWAVAAVLDFFLGGIGIHRMYLGSSPMMWLWYGVTCCGIFGIVPVIDFVVLIVDGVQGDVGKYVGNSSYFMWM